MKVGLVLAVVLVALLAVSADASHQGCHTGQASGFVTLRDDPPHLAGTLPSRFTTQPIFFTARFNCKGRGVQARRVDQGLYEVHFPGVAINAASSDALSAEGVSSSIQILGDIVRVSLRGPLAGSDVASRRDVPFSVIVY